MSYRSTWDGRSGYSGKRHTLRNLLLVLLALGILCFGVLEGLIYSGARTRVTGEPGVMVVFGCKVNRDGPGAMLKDRLDTVLDYLEDHPETNVVLSGGKGDDEHVSEARGMYDYLVANGADGERLVLFPRIPGAGKAVDGGQFPKYMAECQLHAGADGGKGPE